MYLRQPVQPSITHQKPPSDSAMPRTCSGDTDPRSGARPGLLLVKSSPGASLDYSGEIVGSRSIERPGKKTFGGKQAAGFKERAIPDVNETQTRCGFSLP